MRRSSNPTWAPLRRKRFRWILRYPSKRASCTCRPPARMRSHQAQEPDRLCDGRIQSGGRVRFGNQLHIEAGRSDFQVQKGGDAMRRGGIWLWVTLAAAGAGAAFAGDWPQFRGTSASGVGDGVKPPVKWDATKGTNIVWSVEIPGLADSSPIVWGDRIFVTTAISSDPKQTFRTGQYGDTDSANDSSPHQWKVLAIDKKTGKILWQQT